MEDRIGKGSNQAASKLGENGKPIFSKTRFLCKDNGSNRRPQIISSTAAVKDPGLAQCAAKDISENSTTACDISCRRPVAEGASSTTSTLLPTTPALPTLSSSTFSSAPPPPVALEASQEASNLHPAPTADNLPSSTCSISRSPPLPAAVMESSDAASNSASSPAERLCVAPSLPAVTATGDDEMAGSTREDLASGSKEDNPVGSLDEIGTAAEEFTNTTSIATAVVASPTTTDSKSKVLIEVPSGKCYADTSTVCKHIDKGECVGNPQNYNEKHV
ncbi:hypothetical protein DOTSEDRAFT_53459 [Dothistroma septosporum NZE10]|uniref:Uncharacterized protein n=1 Tax=Dothistroma septosporum (strain NZE10 / CBS 128990) TaxID=675120 RepID=N1PPL0_DOTSN|nr:hypothetical protein DOTSEDRAFT_53459 [Dothistroma septosporum NZE10]